MTKIMKDYPPGRLRIPEGRSQILRGCLKAREFDRVRLRRWHRAPTTTIATNCCSASSVRISTTHDDPGSAYPEIRSTLVHAVTQARTTPTKLIETPFGNLPGHSADQIAAPHRSSTSSGMSMSRVPSTPSRNSSPRLRATMRRRWVATVQLLAEPQLDVWKQAGPLVQRVLVDRISALDEASRSRLRPIVLKVLTCALSPEIGGTTSTYNTVTLHRAATPATDLLREVRATHSACWNNCSTRPRTMMSGARSSSPLRKLNARPTAAATATTCL